MINTFKQVVCVRGSCFMPNLDFLQNRVHSGSIRSVLTLTWKISCPRIFPKNLLIQTDREKLTASTKIMTSLMDWFWSYYFFLPNFFFTFFKVNFFLNFCIFGPTKWIFLTLVLIFSKFGMYLTYKNWFWGQFSWFWVRTSTQPFGPGTGPKSKNKGWYLKG